MLTFSSSFFRALDSRVETAVGLIPSTRAASSLSSSSRMRSAITSRSPAESSRSAASSSGERPSANPSSSRSRTATRSSRRRRREQRAALPDRLDAGFAEGLSPELESALRELSAGEREVIALRVLLELDNEEAARVLGISPTAVSTRLSRALKKLEEKVSIHV